MRGRTLALLALLTAGALAGVYLTREPAVGHGPRVQAGARFLPGLEAHVNDVRAVRVRRGGGTVLARVERRGDAWVVTNRFDYPADEETLRGTLIGLARADRVEGKTRRPEAYARLGVADIEQAGADGVEVTLEGIEPSLAVIIGKPSTGDVGGTYVRRVGDRRAWLVSGDIKRHDHIADWLDDRLVDIAPARVRGVRIEAVDGQPVVVRHADPRSRSFDMNVPEGRFPLSNSIAKSLARIVADLRLTDVRPAADMPDLPRLARARFETFGGLVIVIDAYAEGRKGEPARFVRLHANTTANADQDTRERAAALNGRYDGWVYEIQDYKFVNATQTLAGVLEPRADGGEQAADGQ